MNPADIRVVERFFAEGIWKAESALHLGGEPDAWEERADMVLLRGSDGRPFIPGSSLAGAARSSLREAGGESGVLTALFGGDPDRRHTTQYASALTVFDAHLPDHQTMPQAVVRDGVRIDPVNGLAMDRFKYDIELFPAGTSFRLRLLLAIYNQPPHDADHGALLAWFRAVLEGFSGGEIRLGARTNRGLGLGRVEHWNIRRLGIDSREHLAAWLSGAWNEGEPVELSGLPEPVCGSRRRLLDIRATLRLKTSLLNRSGGAEARYPDMVHLSEGGRPLLTGSSFAGVLRARCLRIANTFTPNTASALVDGMFGPRYNPDIPAGTQAPLRASRVRVEESLLSGVELMVQGRVAIDRFTGGALESALFDEAPAYPVDGMESVASVRLTLREPSRRESALLLLAFKDLWLGDLALNGEVAVGRGVFEGVRASIELPDFGCLGMRAAQDGPKNVLLRESIPGAWRQLNETIQSWRGDQWNDEQKAC
jgi:CRISPR/Cas system CSM-associated protein Csm3 (group 7 of RAMP superfamily)